MINTIRLKQNKIEDFSSLTSDQIIIATLQILSHSSWSEISFSGLASYLKTRPLFIYSYFKNKNDILKGIINFVDRKMEGLYLSHSHYVEELTPQEILFEIILCRLEIMSPYKRAFHHLTQTLWHNPLDIIEAHSYFLYSLENILNIAGIETLDLIGFIKKRCFAFFYYQIIQDWFRDTTLDQSLTLVALDKNLSKFTKILAHY